MTAAERLGYRTDRRPVQVWEINPKLLVGDQGIAITVAIMRMAAQAGAKDPQVRELALKITQGVANSDHTGEIDAIYNWVKNSIAFRGEDDELIQAPEVTLRFEGADCDCQSVLLGSLLGSLGYTVDFKTVAGAGEKDFSHVYAVVWDDSSGGWRPLPLDTTVAEAQPGWEPSGISRARLWDGVNRGKVGRNMQVAGGLATMRGWRSTMRLRGLGDDSTDGSDQSAGQQIGEVITAATPIVTTALQTSRGVYQPQYYQQPGQYYPGQGQQQYGVTVSSPNLPLTQRAWFWPAVFGLGALAVFQLGKRRER